MLTNGFQKKKMKEKPSRRFLFNENLRRNQLNLKTSYHKITNLNAGKKLVQQIDNLKNNDINTIVITL